MAQHSSQSGFSLIQVSLILAVGGVILASMLPGGLKNSDSQKISLTIDRMQAVEAAMQRFMVGNGRRPCPASAALTLTNASFGLESTDTGRCVASANFTEEVSTTTTGSAGSSTVTVSSATGIKIGAYVYHSGGTIPAGTRVTGISGTTLTLSNPPTAAINAAVRYSSVSAGMIPVTTLGLPPEYALDGYGRRMIYMVDNRATEKAACAGLQSSSARGNIQIQSTYAADGSTNIDNTMWALLSYGKNGYGSFPAAPASTVVLASRLNSGSADADEQINAFVTSSEDFTFTEGTNPVGILIKKDRTATFDDLVWYTKTNRSETLCGLSAKSSLGTTGTTGSGAASGVVATTLGGSSTGAGTAQTATTNGTHAGSTSAAGYANEGMSLANGDINADGFKDLVTCFTNTNKCYVLFGKATGIGAGTNVVDYNMLASATSPLDGVSGFTITNDLTALSTGVCGNGVVGGIKNLNFGKTLAVGDVNGDSYDDIVIGGTYVTVVYGGPKKDDGLSYQRTAVGTYATAWYTAGGNINVSALDGFKGQALWGGSLAAAGPVAIGDVNGDDYNDIVFASGSSNNIAWSYLGPSRNTNGSAYGFANTNNSIYIVFGVPAVNLAHSGHTSPTCLNIYSGTITPDSSHGDYPVIINGSDSTYLSGPLGYNSLTVGDWNNDGFDDIVYGNYTFTYTLFGWTLGANSGNVVMVYGRDSEWTRVNGSTPHLYDAGLYSGGQGPYYTGTNGWPEGGTSGLNTGAGATAFIYELVYANVQFNGCSGSTQCTGVKAMRFTAENGKYLGSSVAMGDVDGDGVKDIIAASSDALYIYKGQTGLVTTDYYPYYAVGYSYPTLTCTYVTCYQLPYSYLIFNPSYVALGLYNAGTTFVDPAANNSNTATRLISAKFDGDGTNDILLSTLITGKNRGTNHMLKTVGGVLASNAANNAVSMVLTDVRNIPLYSYIAGPNIPRGSYVKAIDYSTNTITFGTDGSDGIKFRSGTSSGARYLFTSALSLIEGPADNAYAYVTTAGDFNMDNAIDVAIGAPSYPGSGSSYGKTYIVWGKRYSGWNPYYTCLGSTTCQAAPTFLNTLD